eukprot:13484-Heterococcus_DN1.PRE.1
MSSLHDSRARIAVEAFNPLHDPDTRAVVFSFLGARQGAFIKSVSKACKAAYEQVRPHEAVVWALASPARFRLAVEWEIPVRVSSSLWDPGPTTYSMEELFVHRGQTTGRIAGYDTLLAAQEADFQIDPSTVAGAAPAGDVQKMVRLHSEWGDSDYKSSAICWAAKGGAVEAMRWLRQQGYNYGGSLLEFVYAAHYGHLDVLHFLHADGYTLAEVRRQSTKYTLEAEFEDPCEQAASKGYLEVFRWLHEHDWPLGSASEYAASAGHIHILMYLREQGVTFNEETMVEAVAGGPLVCQYLRSVECPWDARACTAAGRWGCLDSLRWLHENGCPWDAQAISVESSSIEVIQYVWQQAGTPAAAVLTQMLFRATFCSDVDLEEWLRQKGAVLHAVLSVSTTALLALLRIHRNTSSMSTSNQKDVNAIGIVLEAY